jgi:hypothetical protein
MRWVNGQKAKANLDEIEVARSPFERRNQAD